MIGNQRVNKIFSILKKIDKTLFIASFLQLFIGLAFIFCIGQQSGGVLEKYWVKQTFWIFLGSLSFIFLIAYDYRKLGEKSFWIFLFSLFLLLIVLIPEIGLKINGSQSWIPIGFATLQPSEFAKPAIILFASWYVSHQRFNINNKNNFFEIFIIFIIPILLILAQPDIGSCVVFIGLFFFIIYLNGIKLKMFVYFLLLGILISPLIFSILKPHQKDRINVFIHPIIEPILVRYAQSKAKDNDLSIEQKKNIPKYLNPLKYVEIQTDYNNKQITKEVYKKELKSCRLLHLIRQEEGYNVYQSLLAVGSGGFWGKGFMKGTQNELGFLPQKVAPTDFIFSVIAEELGFLGSSVIILLYLVILYRTFRIALNATERYGRVISMMIGFMLFIHLYINLGMTMGIAPVIGIPLPFMSYGGSFIVSTMICLGLLQSIYVHRSKNIFHMIDDEK